MKIKLLIFSILAYILLFASASYAETIEMNLKYDNADHYYSAEKINININGNEITNLPMPPILFNDYTLAPAREIFENVGASVDWDGKNYIVNILYNNNDVVLDIKNGLAYVNNSLKDMDVPPKIINDKTMIPIRFVSESVGLNIDWDDNTRTVHINNDLIDNNSVIDDTVQADNVETDNNSINNSIEINNINNNINNIEYIYIPDYKNGDFVINTSSEISDFNTMFITGNRLVVDINNSKIACDKNEYQASHFFVSKIRLGQVDQNTARVVFDMYSQCNYNVSYANNKRALIVSFNNGAPDEIKSSLNNSFLFDNKNLCFVFNKNGQDINSFIYIDDYINKKYTIDLNGDYSNILPSSKINIDNQIIKEANIVNENNKTKLIIDEKQILAFTASEDENNIYIHVRQPKEIYPNILVVDAGHGGYDNGASANGLIEKNLTVDIVNRIVKLCEKDDFIKCYASRTSDFYPSFDDRNNLGNAVGDVFVSVHINSAGTNTQADGTELYSLYDNDVGSGLTSTELAATLQKNLVNYLGSNNRGTKSANFIVLRQSIVPAALCEIGFITNPSEASKMASEEYRQKAAEAIYQSLKELFEKYPSYR